MRGRQRPDDIVQRLLAVTSGKELERLIRSEPEILGDQVLRELRALAGTEGFGVIFERLVVLLTHAKTDPAAAFAVFREEMELTEAQARLVDR